ncbi:MAG TPA: dihydroorotase [Actinomycetota bacterium]|nr:dihydroorotase [Actinomycetota bacterium]
MAEPILIKGGRLVDPAAGRDVVLDVRIDGGHVAEIGPDLSADGGLVVDAAGLVVAPGFVDLHTHLREPGREDAETIESGTRAAVLGGYTAVSAMANTDPIADSAGIVEQVWNLGRAAGWCDVHPVGAITAGLRGEMLAEIGEMAASTAKVSFFSDDGTCVNDAALMRRALEYARAFDAVVANHAEEGALAEGWSMNEGEVSALLGMRGLPAEAEEIIVARDIMLARLTGGRLHVPHVSTAGTVELIRAAKARGIPVTAEVTPHHLSLTEDSVRSFDPVYKVAPPLRTKADVEAVREALADGTIDCVATDHAPHTLESKDVEFDLAPCGMIGLETALSVVLTDTSLDLTAVVERMSVAPARIRRLKDQGGPIAEGSVANLVVFDPDATWTVNPHGMASKSRNTPFAGRELKGKVLWTIYRGRVVVSEGRIDHGKR